MKRNINEVDRLFRLIIALVLFGCAYWKWSWILLIFALFVLFEALFGWCVLFQILGKSSCPIEKNKK